MHARFLRAFTVEAQFYESSEVLLQLNRYLISILLFIVFLFLTAQAYAGENPPLQGNVQAQAASGALLPGPAVPVKTPPTPVVPVMQLAAGAGQVSLNFDDADVFSVVQTIFGDILRVNYVIDPKVKGRVNFRSVAPVPREKVLPVMEVILRLNGIGVVEDAGLYRIVPIGDLSKEPSPVSFGRASEKITVTGRALLQVIPIQYLQSSDLLRMLSPFLSTNAVVVDVPKSNQIIVVDTDASVKRIVQLVEIFDSDKLKKRAEVFVYPVQNGNAKEVSVLLQQIFLSGKGPQEKAARKAPAGQGGSASAPQAPAPPPVTVTQGTDIFVSDVTKILADEITNTIVILATPEDYTLIRDTIRKIDLIPRQVVIEGVIASVTLTDNLSLGMAAAVKANVFGLDTTIGLNASSLNIDPTKPTGSGLSIIGVESGNSVRALITALASDSKAKLLAAPHILVSDNREARIQVGQQVPIVTAETYGTPGIAPQRIVQYKDIGIILKVKPRVNDGGLVALDMSQEVSTFSTITLFASEQQIIINKTEATTNLVVQDGQTIVIGGLIREDKSKSRSGIPFLYKIPIIGWLFGNTDDTDQRTEIIILLTPRVIKSPKDAKVVTSEYIESLSGTSKGGIRKEELIKDTRQPKP